MKAKMLIVALVPFLVASCYDQTPAENNTRATAKDLSGGVTRYHDSELGVTCWSRSVQSISCLRDVDDTAVAPTPKPKIVDSSWYERHPFGVEEQVIEFPEDGPARHVAGGPGA